MAKQKSPAVYIGHTVIYYPGGDTSQKPGVARVVDHNGAGKLHLLLYPRNGGTFSRPLKGVCHIDDPELKEKPEMLRALGCWETLEEYEARVDLGKEEREQKAKKAASTIVPQRSTSGGDGN